MAVNDVLNQLQTLIRGSAQPLIEISDQPTREVAPFVPGERYTATVQEQVANGRFLVQVRDQTLDLNLPRNTQPGQNLQLRFVSNEPRLTFVLDNAQAQTGSAQGGPVNLSDGARYLSALLDRVQTLANQQAAPDKSQAQAALGLLGAKPLLAGAPPAPEQFAAQLKQAIGQSGLFYESHQAQWANGERGLGELLREPQASLSEPRAFNAAASPAGQGLAASPGTTHDASLGERASQLPSGGADHSGAEPVHPQTAPLVQQQLQVLDSRQLVWQGQVWPGQDLRWQIEERAAHEDGAAVEREWQTRLDLQLPNLGAVNAVLSISPRGELRIALRAQAAETAQALRGAGAALNQQLTDAGLRLSQLEVARDG